MAKRKSKRWTATDLKTKPKGKGSATKPALCRLCGFHHWNRDPHIFPKDTIKYDDVKVKTDV